jgi:hypothetical protein
LEVVLNLSQKHNLKPQLLTDFYNTLGQEEAERILTPLLEDKKKRLLKKKNGEKEKLPRGKKKKKE